MSAQTLRFSLTEGIMRQQGSAVPREQFAAADRLSRSADTSGDWVAGMMCKPDQRAIDLNQPIAMSMTGADRAQQPAPDRATGRTDERRPAQPRARMGHRVSEDGVAAHVRSDHRLDDVLRAGADGQSARTRHAQRVREMGVRRRRAAALVAVVRRARQHGQVWRWSSATRAATCTPSMRRPERRSGKPPARHDAFGGDHRRAGARRQSHHRADLLLRRRPRRRSEARMLRRTRRCRRARREQRPEAVDRAHDGRCEVHGQGQLDRREAARPVRRADLVDAFGRYANAASFTRARDRRPRCPRPIPATPCSRSMSRPAS